MPHEIPPKAIMELEFGRGGSYGEEKSRELGEKPLGARREPTANSTTKIKRTFSQKI